MEQPRIFFISADRKASGWTRGCRHQHPDIDAADKCAEKRNAEVIVCDPDERVKPAIVPAPYLAVRRQRRRIVESAEHLLRGGEHANAFTVYRDDGRDLRFQGVVLGRATSYVDGSERWTEITIFKTDKGNYVASVVGLSIVPGESDRYKAVRSNSAEDIVTFLSHPVKRFLTIVAKGALEAAAVNDDSLAGALVEEV